MRIGRQTMGKNPFGSRRAVKWVIIIICFRFGSSNCSLDFMTAPSPPLSGRGEGSLMQGIRFHFRCKISFVKNYILSTSTVLLSYSPIKNPVPSLFSFSRTQTPLVIISIPTHSYRPAAAGDRHSSYVSVCVCVFTRSACAMIKCAN